MALPPGGREHPRAMDRHGGGGRRGKTGGGRGRLRAAGRSRLAGLAHAGGAQFPRGTRHEAVGGRWPRARDRKSTRLNSSHLVISYAVFCLKKKKKKYELSIHKKIKK